MQVRAHADEENTQAGLWHAEVCGINDSGLHHIFAIQPQISEDLLANAATCDILKSRHVLHDEDFRPQSTDDGHKLAIQTVARIVDDALVIAHLGEGLAWRPADDHIDWCRSCCVEKLGLYLWISDIAENERGSVGRLIEVEGRSSPCVRVIRSGNMESCLPEAFGKSASSAEQV